MNACSSLVAYDIFKPNAVVMNTIISSASAGLLIMLNNQYNNTFLDEKDIQNTQLKQYFDIHTLCGGVLAGLISITGASANVALWGAALIGAIGSVIYTFTKKAIERYEIDDPLDNTEIHGICGIWSIIAVGIFDMD